MFEDGLLQLPQALVAAKIELDSYVDDQLTENKAKLEVVGKGGFRYKSKTYTGSDKLGTKASCGTS